MHLSINVSATKTLRENLNLLVLWLNVKTIAVLQWKNSITIIIEIHNKFLQEYNWYLCERKLLNLAARWFTQDFSVVTSSVMKSSANHKLRKLFLNVTFDYSVCLGLPFVLIFLSFFK